MAKITEHTRDKSPHTKILAATDMITSCIFYVCLTSQYCQKMYKHLQALLKAIIVVTYATCLIFYLPNLHLKIRKDLWNTYLF